jgi:hypothetical protein
LLAQQPADRVRMQVNALPIGGKLTVTMLDGTEYHGNLSAIDPATFSIREVDLRMLVSVSYSVVDSVSRNYGRKGFGGRRVSPRRNLIAGLLIVGGLLTLVIVAVAADKS